MRMEFTVFLSQKTAGRTLQLHWLPFGVFFCIFANISTPVLSQHIQGVKNLLNCASKREGGKIIEKDKNNIFFLLV